MDAAFLPTSRYSGILFHHRPRGSFKERAALVRSFIVSHERPAWSCEQRHSEKIAETKTIMSNENVHSQSVVLVVIADPVERSTVRKSLESDGFQVEEATDGKQALEVFDIVRPHVVLLDIALPGLSGIECCAALRKRPDGSQVIILMMAGTNETDAIAQGYETGASDFTVKPIHSLILIQRIRYLLRVGLAFHALAKSEVRLSHAQRIAGFGSWEWRPATDALQCKDHVARIFGINPKHFPDTLTDFLTLIHPDDRDMVRKSLYEGAEKEQQFSMEYRIPFPDGTERLIQSQAEPIRGRSNRVEGMVGIIQDITDRKRAEEKIHFLAYYDSLTGLPNRHLLKDRLTHALTYAQRHQAIGAILHMDLDRFKIVNDTLGHAVGDCLLQGVAERLKTCVRTSDSVARDADSDSQSLLARLGGDEFTVLLNNLIHPHDAERVAQRIQRELAKPFKLEQREVFITTTIGIACFPVDGADTDALLKNADTAMYSAKSLSHAGYQFYSRSMNEQTEHQRSLEAELRHALDRDEFVVYFQPQVDLHTGAIVGAEALVRWHHPTKGVLPPNRFISLAENSGMGAALGERVLRKACTQAKGWSAAGYPTIQLAVNLSDSQFHDCNLAKLVAEVLTDTEFPSELLDLELTETIVVRDPERSLAMLQELRAAGVKLSLDDFGTGYSSLQHLQQYPINALKIDQSFVRNIVSNQRDASITKTVIMMARNLGLRILAEGVETQDQLDFLREHGCEEVQGFIVSRPLPPDQFLQFVAKHIATGAGRQFTSFRRFAA